MANFTKKAIIETFVQLLNEYPLDKITVKDIVNECGINRNTFYYYYQDIYALLEDIMNLEIERVTKETKDYASWKEGCALAIRFSLENRKAIYHIYNSISRDHIDRYFDAVLGYFMKEYVELESKDLKVSEEDKNLIVLFYKCAISGLIMEWINKGMKKDAKDVLDHMERIFEGSVREAIMKASK